MNDPMKVVVVKSPRILAGILRFLFKIRKEETE
ncbi:MAG: stage V sporulation protein SpoVM [Angelakisella sp.]|nr:stage V sporulation protein SpoVM [Angelakisella sp.]